MAHPPIKTTARPQIQQLLNTGTQLMQTGRLSEAEQTLRQALALDPDNADVLQLLGLIAARANQPDWAEQFLHKAARLQPRRADIQNNLGGVLLSAGRIDDAITQFRNATRIDPANGQLWFNLGNALRAGKQAEAAVAAYRKALARQPDSLPALVNLGHALREQDLIEEASEVFAQAVAMAPQILELRLDLGHLCNLLLRLDEAEQHYGAVLAVQPRHPKAMIGMTAVRLARHELREALELCEAVVRLFPDMAEAYLYLSKVHWQAGRHAEAIEAASRALDLAPDEAELYSLIGAQLDRCKRHDQVLAALNAALNANPNNALARVQRMRTRQEICDWAGIEGDFTFAATTVREGAKSIIGPFLALSMPGMTPHIQYINARNTVSPLKACKPLPNTQRRPGRLRIGYLSADMREHAMASLIVEVFELHDREQFEVFAYSTGPDDGSAMRRRMESAFEHFNDIRELSHEQAARRIQDDGIDILCDVIGYTIGARTEILAMRPAPIQVNCMCYAGTMGADFMDYILVDPFVVPPSQAPFYTEKLAYLPDTYLPNDRKREMAPAPTRAEAGLPENAFVFCCFNNSYKITPGVFDIWCGLLAAVPGSVLWLLAANPWAEENLRKEAAARGIDASRLIFAPKKPHAEHLARIALADLFLDTLPYNAHTTASDALWAGVPVVTCAGDTFPSRVAGSLLRAVGLPELVTERLDAYRDLALRLATQPDELKAIRQKLAENRLSTPLFDSERFTRNLEGLYRRMWERHEQGLPPDMLAPS